MSEQVVVICSIGDGRSTVDLCAKLEEQGLTCWSPVREEDPDAARWSLPSKMRSARAMVVVTRDIGEHADAVERAAQNKIPVIVASPDDDGRWLGVMRELADALGLSAEWLIPRGTSPGALPKTHIADDETEFLEFIAEHVSEAQVFVRFGLFDKAVDRLKMVFVKAPRNLEAHDEILKIYLDVEEWKKAAGTAADFLECLRYRGDNESYEILRLHLEARGFSVHDGPPVAVGYADVDPVPTKFFDATPKAPAPAAATPSPGPGVPAAVPPARPVTPAAPAPAPGPVPRPAAAEPPPALELPALRNFKSSQAVFQTSGIESELSGIDFFVEHGMLDEARMRLEQLAHEQPDHPGVIERRSRIESLSSPIARTGIVLELEDPWEAAAKADSSGDILLDAGFTPAPEPVPSPPVTPVAPTPAKTAAPTFAGPVSGEGETLICTVLLPATVEPGDMFTMRVCLHQPGQGSHPMFDSPHDRREANMLVQKVRRGRAIELTLDLPGFELDTNRFDMTWTGQPDSVEFSVVVPFTQSAGIVSGTLSIVAEQASAGDFSIHIPVS
jgi:hypothetical protein